MTRLLLAIIAISVGGQVPMVSLAQETVLQGVTGLPHLPSDFDFDGKASIQTLMPLGNRSAKTHDRLQPANTHAVWSATIEPAEIVAGGQGKIVLRAEVLPGYHIYPYRPDNQLHNRTLIVATQKSQLRLAAPRTSAKVLSKEMGGFLQEHYAQSVTWDIPIEVPEHAKLGEQAIELQVGFNTCDATSCDPPAAVQFSGAITVAKSSGHEATGMRAQQIDFQLVEKSKILNCWIDGLAVDTDMASQLAGEPLQAWMILAALTGGFILNFMPCVLPVVGLKLMSFVNQAGSSRTQIIKLNLSFVAGILLVVLVLAGFNILTKLGGQAVGWGEQFNSFPLQVSIVILLFAMSLSFLGVWEIPIPGFATSSRAGQLLEREGCLGAFYKGVLTTLLATPCSGPLLGAVFGETLMLSAAGSLAVFVSVGIGLGLPYLVICLWPSSVRLLPRPGPWMDTFRQILAFPLLLSMVWFLNVIDAAYHIAVLVVLIAVWFACWIVGRLPVYAERHTRFRVTITAIAVCTVTGIASFKYLGTAEKLLPWQPYSEAALELHRSQGKVVMIDFTARWCLTCQANMRLAIERPEVAKMVARHQVVTLLADWTDTSTDSINANEIRRKVHELESNSIPLLAIYPADRTARPIVLRDMITQRQLLQALERAVPVQSAKVATLGDMTRQN